MRIAVAGGTGAVGKHVVAALHRQGHEPVVLARSTGVDLSTGAGLDQALKGAQAVIDVSNIATTSAKRSRAFFETATGYLLAASARAGVSHHVALSIVGIERVPGSYYAGKLAQEQLIRAGSVPWTVLRATQFHEFAGQILARTPGPIAVVPQIRTQPIAAREVAASLAELATGSAQGLLPDLAGPEQHELVELCRRVLRCQGSRRRVLPVRLPGADGRAIRTGALLPTMPGRRGRLTFDAWLGSADRAHLDSARSPS